MGCQKLYQDAKSQKSKFENVVKILSSSAGKNILILVKKKLVLCGITVIQWLYKLLGTGDSLHLSERAHNPMTLKHCPAVRYFKL